MHVGVGRADLCRNCLRAYEIFGDAMYQGYGQTEILPIAMTGPCCVPAGCRCLFAQLQVWDEDNKPTVCRDG
jgi:acyl-coenzyme A synthetase/AMP-(fatty) acid ligase